MTSPVPPTGYATVDDYELRTGVQVPAEQTDQIQTRLNDVSTMIVVYLGPCADAVSAAYPDILTTITCLATQRSFMVPLGVRSESVGSTSVSYETSAESGWLQSMETEVLDRLMYAACPERAMMDPLGVGELGVGQHQGSGWYWGPEPSWYRDP